MRKSCASAHSIAAATCGQSTCALGIVRHALMQSPTDGAGPTNNWMSPPEARDKLSPLFRGAMKGRTMYVVPFLMGPAGSKFSKVGVEITDSKYVVLNMRIMTRVGKPALEHLGGGDD